MNNKKNSSESILLKLALGAALAASAGYAYFTHKEEIDAEAKKRINQLAKAFRQSKAVVEERARKIWGEANKQAIATYLDVRANLLHALEEEQLKRTGQIAKQRYEALVDLAVKKAQKAGLLKNTPEKKLQAVLKGDWKEIQKIMMEQMNEAGKKVKKILIKKKAVGVVQKGRNAVRDLMKNRSVRKTIKKGKKAVKRIKKTEQKAAKAIKKSLKR